MSINRVCFTPLCATIPFIHDFPWGTGIGALWQPHTLGPEGFPNILQPPHALGLNSEGLGPNNKASSCSREDTSAISRASFLARGCGPSV